MKFVVEFVFPFSKKVFQVKFFEYEKTEREKAKKVFQVKFFENEKTERKKARNRALKFRHKTNRNWAFKIANFGVFWHHQKAKNETKFYRKMDFFFI